MPNSSTDAALPAAAIVLAGGRSSRMGRDKATLTRDGRSLLSLAVDAASRVGPVLVVASDAVAASTLDDAARRRVHAVVLEDPPFGGPVAGIAAGVTALPDRTAEVLVLACDLPRADEAVGIVLAEPLDGHDGVAPVDAEGFPQLLAARYRAAALREAAQRLDSVRDVSVRRLVKGLDLRLLPLPDETRAAALEDVDDPEAAARHGLR